ncbi:MAG: hypothetical protein ACOCUT_00060 [bacterium]
MSKNAVMAISTKQAKAVAKAHKVRFPCKDNGWVKIGQVTLRRLPAAFRKSRKNAKAYRLTAKNHEELSEFYDIVNAHGTSACIVWKN